MDLTTSQLNQLKKKGISENTFKQQIQNFETGFPFAKLERAATPGDGIRVYDANEVDQFIKVYDKTNEDLSILKFVPASGAATRMFKFLFQAINEDHYFIDEDVNYFFQHLTKFAFYPTLQEHVGSYNPEDEDYRREVLKTLLFKPPFEFAHKPKGLIPFHEVDHKMRLSFEEHFSEAIAYAKTENTIRLHFTISVDHHKLFEKEAKILKDHYEKLNNLNVEVSFSYQQEHTDMVAVDMKNSPVIKSEEFFFRPGGHGALIENLDELEADLIFIKNIDNVVPPRFSEEVARYKKLLAGNLLVIREKLFALQKKFLANGYSQNLETEAQSFAKEELDISTQLALSNADQLAAFLFKPIRVCGMVKNQGEPGGGPFWIKNKENVSLQIVEKSQVEVENQSQLTILNNATHFNPVDLVCCTKNVSGEAYELNSFVDPSAGFIAEKSLDGKPIKAQELPGLWNGAMADWHTLFVEVPLVTFNPVKTVNDLLKVNHQPK